MQSLQILFVVVLILNPSRLNSYSYYSHTYIPPYKDIKVKEIKEMPVLIPDWKLVVLTAIQEASTEGLIGMTVVCEVIRDRAATKYNSDGTIPGTVLAPKQFSGWNTNDPNRIRSLSYDISHPAMVDAIRAYKNAFEKRTNYAMGANLYHADYMDPYPPWSKAPNVVRLGQVGTHILYLEKR